MTLPDAPEKQLEECIIIDNVQYCIYGDSGYSRREFIEVPFQGSDMSDYIRKFNADIYRRRMSLEWALKELKNYWNAIFSTRKIHILKAPVGLLHQDAALLSQFRN